MDIRLATENLKSNFWNKKAFIACILNFKTWLSFVLKGISTGIWIIFVSTFKRWEFSNYIKNNTVLWPDSNSYVSFAGK